MKRSPRLLEVAKAEASDDDLLDEETQSDKAAANITKENKATEAAPEPPIEKALREVERGERSWRQGPSAAGQFGRHVQGLPPRNRFS